MKKEQQAPAATNKADQSSAFKQLVDGVSRFTDEEASALAKVLKEDAKRRREAARAAAPRMGDQVRIVRGPKAWLGKTGRCVASGGGRLAVEVPNVGTRFVSNREVERLVAQ